MNKDNLDNNSQIIYFSHGGGPLPLLNDHSHDEMIQYIKRVFRTYLSMVKRCEQE